MRECWLPAGVALWFYQYKYEAEDSFSRIPRASPPSHPAHKANHISIMYFKAVVVFAITCCELVIVKLVICRCCQDLPYAIFYSVCFDISSARCNARTQGGHLRVRMHMIDRDISVSLPLILLVRIAADGRASGFQHC